MNSPALYLIFVLLLSALPLAARAQMEPVTMARALELGVEGLSENASSEVGMNRAATLYAIAKRLQTENTLAKRNLELVEELDTLRNLISPCRRGPCELAYIVNGGGTMYSHGAARDVSEVEDFLAGLSKQFPLPSGTGSPKATTKMDAAIIFLQSLKPYESGDAATDKESSVELAAEKQRVIAHWENLKSMIEQIPAAQAEAIAAFADNSLSWLKDEE